MPEGSHPRNNIPNNAFGNFPNGLAIILTIGTIAVIITLIAIHITTVMQNQATFDKVFDTISQKMSNDTNATEDLLESFQNYYREANSSTTALLGILLPVIGAWIGAILAFYYGNKNMEKMSESLKAAVTSPEEDKLAKMTVAEVFNKMPEYKQVNMAKISDPVGASYKMITAKSTNIVLTDDSNHPLGIIYKTDFTRNSAKKEDDIINDKNSFQDFFQNMKSSGTPIRDLIRNEEWTNKGVNNYARIGMKDTLLEARAKMQGVSVKPETRGLVLEGENTVIGVVTYELFSNVISSEALEKA